LAWSGENQSRSSDNATTNSPSPISRLPAARNGTATVVFRLTPQTPTGDGKSPPLCPDRQPGLLESTHGPFPESARREGDAGEPAGRKFINQDRGRVGYVP
jgi:hypothetical protein